MTIDRRALSLLAPLLLALGGFVLNFDGYPLLDPDEGRNAEVMREMAATNDYVLPSLNGLPYVDKPALYFAVGALGMEVLGPTVLAARLPSLLFMVATLIAVGWFASRLFGAGAAWTAMIATAATPFALAYARTVIFDSALTFFVVSSLAAFFVTVERPDDRGAVVPRAVAWSAMALGVLTKGPVAIAFPVLVAVPFALIRRRARALVDAPSLLMFLAIVMPWTMAVSLEVPGFLEHSLLTETAARLATPALQRTGPAWYFLVILPVAALPWSLIALEAAVDAARSTPRRAPTDPRLTYLLLWVIGPLLFFTLSQSKRPQYVLPVIPAIAMLVAARWRDVRGRLPGVRTAAIALGGFGIFLVAARGAIPSLVPASPHVAAAIPKTAFALGAVCVAAAVGSWLAAHSRAVVCACLALPVAAIPAVSGDLMTAIGRDRSARELAVAVAAVLPPSGEVIAVRTFPLSLPFYLRRTLLLATPDARELTSNYLVRYLDHWRAGSGSLRPADWWRDALSDCRRPYVFVVGTDDASARATLAARLPLLAETRKQAAYGPCGAVDLARGG